MFNEGQWWLSRVSKGWSLQPNEKTICQQPLDMCEQLWASWSENCQDLLFLNIYTVQPHIIDALLDAFAEMTRSIDIPMQFGLSLVAMVIFFYFYPYAYDCCLCPRDIQLIITVLHSLWLMVAYIPTIPGWWFSYDSCLFIY